jgi:pyruvate dehydrogenase E2 component (dihydrolipoamide acetyltransferase)
MAEFVMPQLGADMKAGKLLGWRKKVGDRVSRGDIIADVETEKADIEVEVFATGVVERILVEPGQKVPIGTLLAIIREEGKPTPVGPPPVAAVPPPIPMRAPTLVPVAPVAVSPAVGAPAPARLHISPAARKLATELYVDAARIEGTGPGGRVTLEDVRHAAQAKVAEPTAKAAEVAMDKRVLIRQTIAAAMTRAKREIPHYYLSTTIDMGKALAWLAQENLKRSVEQRIVYGVLLLKAVALALREIPELNSLWTERGPNQSSDVHLGVAISLRGGGLVAPALHHTDQLPLDELMKSFRDLVRRARAGSLRSSEMSDPTITVTNLGEQGVETVFGIIYPPQVALVGFGKIVDRPWSSEGQIVLRPLITASLSADHRVSDGHRGGLFLNAVDRILQEPDKL